MWTLDRNINTTECVCVCVYLLSEQNTGQKATAVAESPTSKMDEHGLISRGSTGSSEHSSLHGPHTITYMHTPTHTRTCPHTHTHTTLYEQSEMLTTQSAAICFITSLPSKQIRFSCFRIKPTLWRLPSCPGWMSQSICCRGSSHMTRWFDCVWLCPSPCVRTVRTGALQRNGREQLI